MIRYLNDEIVRFILTAPFGVDAYQQKLKQITESYMYMKINITYS